MEFVGQRRAWEVWQKHGVGVVKANFVRVEDGALVFYLQPMFGDENAVVHHVCAPGCWDCAVPLTDTVESEVES